LTDTVKLGKLLFGNNQHGGELGDIHGGAAAQTKHDIATGSLCLLDAGKQYGFRRIGYHVVEHADTESRLFERRQRMVEDASLVQALVRHDQNPAFRKPFAEDFAEALRSAPFDEHRADGIERKWL